MANSQNQNRLPGTSPDIDELNNPSANSEGEIFEIHVKGQLNDSWLDWLEGLEMKRLDNGEMILFGPIVDQAALMGILNKLSRLNLALISVNQVKWIQNNP